MGAFSFDLKKATKRTLKLDVLRTDGDTQPREGIDQSVVNDYADCYKAKRKLPPVHCVHDGTSFWLVDGFHRRFGADKAGVTKLECLVVPGTLEDARWCSYAANQGHGLRRSVEDKVRAVKAALKHPNAAEMSDHLIAEHVGVSHKMVGKYRELGTVPSSDEDPPKRVGKDGKHRPAKPKKSQPPELPQEPVDDEAEDDAEEVEDVEEVDGELPEEADDITNQSCIVVRNRLEQFCDAQLNEFDYITPQLMAALLEAAAESMLRSV